MRGQALAVSIFGAGMTIAGKDIPAWQHFARQFYVHTFGFCTVNCARSDETTRVRNHFIGRLGQVVSLDHVQRNVGVQPALEELTFPT
ncbi:hypothetical protein D3C80_1916550 [compost metagenome]